MYPSDLTDAQWTKLEPLLSEAREARHAGGQPRKYPLRRVVDAVLYVVKTGCQWRQMPADFPTWQTVYQQFRAWRQSRVWEWVGKALREQGRKAQGRNASPSVAIIDSQSVKTALKWGDAGKKIKGRKRHIAVDTQGNLLAVIVHSAGIQDRLAARAVLMRLFCLFGTVQTVFVDGGYTGTLIDWAKQRLFVTFGEGVSAVRVGLKSEDFIRHLRRGVEADQIWRGHTSSV